MTGVSFVPQTLRLDLYAGDGAALRLTVKDSAGNPVTVTGTVTAQIRASRDDTTAAQTFTVNVATNIVTLSLTAAQTRQLAGVAGSWDCQWAPAGAEPVTLMQGPVFCSQDVTRAP